MTLRKSEISVLFSLKLQYTPILISPGSNPSFSFYGQTSKSNLILIYTVTLRWDLYFLFFIFTFYT